MSSLKSGKTPYYLGIETGATRTTALKVDSDGAECFQGIYRPANLRMISNGSLKNLFETIKIQAGDVAAVAVGMAGLRTPEDRTRVFQLLSSVWPETPLVAASDMEIAFESLEPWGDEAEALVLILSGTGSCVYGINKENRTVKFGGRGHILGDQGSAYDIAIKALRAVVYQYDLHQGLSGLGQSLLRVLQLNHPDDLISWSQEAGKQEIANLAITVFEEASGRDPLALGLIQEAVTSLSDMGLRCAEQLVATGQRVKFTLTGGTLLKQPGFASLVSLQLRESWPHSTVGLQKEASIRGAVALARKLISSAGEAITPRKIPSPMLGRSIIDLDSLADSPTERRNPLSVHLDTMSLEDAIKLMVDENVSAINSILDQRDNVKWLIEQTVTSFQSGGRLFYAGAGTSGRLGVLDASECPPTFRVSPEQVQGIIAGGARAIWSAVEGAEDNYFDGAMAVRHRGVRKGDVLLGIASSGRTPFVRGALSEARRLGAITCLLCFNPGIKLNPEDVPDKIIAVDAGPEVLTGSTRLKAGTATKVILNTLTTLAMTHTGLVVSNLMVNLNPSNDKLRRRAIRIVREITGCDEGTAVDALEASSWMVKNACLAIQSHEG